MSLRCAILIISHKEQLTPTEAMVLQQCYTVLKGVDTFIITKKSNTLQAYYDLLGNPRFYLVEDRQLATYEAFNEFKSSEKLYQDFLAYDYVLFYEPDAWVFSNQLDYWMQQGYDYIAAPWFSSMERCDPNATFIGVGNGGFSLRKTNTLYQTLKRTRQLRSLHRFWNKYHLHRLMPFEKMVLRLNRYFKIGKFWELPYLLDETPMQEDVFICYRLASIFADFRIATPEEALKFSFEVNPAVLYQHNREQLPFGCHAWQKYDPAFWSAFIPQPQPAMPSKG